MAHRAPSPHPALAAAADAAASAFKEARAGFSRAALLEDIADGADGTPTKRLDELVERAVLAAVEPYGLDVVSEEIGHVDRGSATSIVVDPVDGTGNAAAGVPVSAFTAAIAVDGRFTEGLTHWLDLDRRWWAHVDEEVQPSTTGRRSLDGAMVSMIRPKGDGGGFLAIARRCDRIRVLGSSSIEAALVADGVIDAALDAGSRTHRLVDLAAALVLLERAGGTLVDVHGSPIEYTVEIDRRWSGVAAATPELAAELIETITSAA